MSLRAMAGREAYRIAGAAAPFCKGWRWIPLAVICGAAPFLISWNTGLPGHALVSSVPLTLLCLAAVRVGDSRKAFAVVALTYLAHSIAVFYAASSDPKGTAGFLPGAADYWSRQVSWITTGIDPEYRTSGWLWAHIQLFGAMLVYAPLSLGLLPYYEGFREVDLMNYYVAQLWRSGGGLRSVAAGWHLWSLSRGIGFALVIVEVVRASFLWLCGKAVRWRYGALAAGLLFLLLDGLLKAYLLETVRQILLKDLQGPEGILPGAMLRGAVRL